MSDDPRGIEVHDAPDRRISGGHRPIVEGEQPRLQLGERNCTGQAKRAENRCSLPLSISTAGARPSACASAVSKLSDPLALIGAGLEPVDDHVDVVADILVELRQGSISWISPSMRMRTKPCARRSPIRSSCSPLRPATTGAGSPNGFLRVGQHGIDHLRDALRLEQVLRMVRAVRRAGSGKERAQIIVESPVTVPTVERGLWLVASVRSDRR